MTPTCTQVNQTLVELDLSMNGLAEQGAIAIAESLQVTHAHVYAYEHVYVHTLFIFYSQ